MDEKELEQQEELDLNSILNEFHNPDDMQEAQASSVSLTEAVPETEAQGQDAGGFSPEPAGTAEELPADLEEADTSTLDISDADTSDMDVSDPDVYDSEEPADDEAETAPEDSFSEESEGPEISALQFTPEEEAPSEEDGEDLTEEEPQVQPTLYYDPQAKLRNLKHKLVSGPEKRYYALSEKGVGKLQIGVFINLLLVLLCAAGAVLFAAGKVPENRMKLLIFTQVLSMLISGLTGLNIMLDGFTELFKCRFSMKTLLGITFLACLVDAAFSLRDLRVPCCAAFCLQMVFALSSRCHVRNMEMGQMDTLRKAVRLHSLIKVPDYYKGQSGYLRTEGHLEDFMDTYSKSSGPRKLQSFYAFLSLLICIGISVLAGSLHGAAMAVQIFAASLMVAVPASFFIALTRPAAILERRLHMVGTVICGWAGVKELCGRGAFPIGDRDLFPQGSMKLNGIKFYSDRDPDMVVSYTSSLILEAHSGLIPIFEQLMNSRGVVSNPVRNFQIYEGGGIGGEVCGEPVLLGSTEFLKSMGVNVPAGSEVNQAVYAAIDGELCAVVAISFAKMRSAAAGMVTLCGYRKLTPLFLGGDFVFSEDFIRSKFEINTRRLQFPGPEERIDLLARIPQEECPGLALSTRPDLISFAYAVTGARALRSCSKNGMLLHLAGGILGMLSMLILAITGSTELLTPVNILLFQLVWLVPGFLITEWTRHV